MDERRIHLFCGPTGAGKTTYARGLSRRIGAVRFSIDEWMTALFWMDTPHPLTPSWSLERVERCQVLIWATALQVAVRGTPCVLEIGLARRDDRARFVRLAADAALSLRLHLVDAPQDERRRRVAARNADESARQLPFAVTSEMFDFVETLWEPPSEKEMAACDGVRATT
jgi:predicted kinase